MFGFARYVFWKWFGDYRLWTALASLVSLVLAWLHVPLLSGPVLSWFWVGLAILFAYITALKTEWDDYKEQSAGIAIRPGFRSEAQRC
jgi:hypothetical protein